jgi:hypothetical protein
VEQCCSAIAAQQLKEKNAIREAFRQCDGKHGSIRNSHTICLKVVGPRIVCGELFLIAASTVLYGGGRRPRHSFFREEASMQKILSIGILAISAIACSQQQASAWVNSRFGIGFNWQVQSGGNNFLWGAFHNGQPPGPEAYGFSSAPTFPHYGSMSMLAPFAYDAPSFESAHAQTPMPMQQPYGQPFQFATYSRPVYYYYGR